MLSPIHDGDEIDKPFRHGDIADIGRPHVVGLGNRQVSQGIRIDPMPGGGL